MVCHSAIVKWPVQADSLLMGLKDQSYSRCRSFNTGLPHKLFLRAMFHRRISLRHVKVSSGGGGPLRWR